MFPKKGLLKVFPKNKNYQDKIFLISFHSLKRVTETLHKAFLRVKRSNSVWCLFEVRLFSDEHVHVRSIFKKWCSSPFNVRKNGVRPITNHYGKPRRTLIWGDFTLETTSSGRTIYTCFICLISRKWWCKFKKWWPINITWHVYWTIRNPILVFRFCKEMF